MRCSLLSALVVAALVVSPGCGSSEAPQVASAPAHAGPVPSDPVARAAYEFLDAVRRGDTTAASSLLTPLALQKTSELDLNFSPPGSATAKFTIGEVEIIEADKAVVDSTWTDHDADGNVNQEQIIWALRLSEGKWRISGMAAELGSDRPSVVIDFENPEALVQQPQKTAPAGGQAAASANPLQADRSTQDPFQTPVQR